MKRNNHHPIPERCAICGCELHRVQGAYANATIQGRSGASRHHFVPERFFGRSANRPGTTTQGIFTSCPWGHERESDLFCYECHELLLHNPVLLPEDVASFAELVRMGNLTEEVKPGDHEKIAGRIMLFHEVIKRGLATLHKEEAERCPSPGEGES
jgi:hypothetical protein